jgi:hypothetical protein
MGNGEYLPTHSQTKEGHMAKRISLSSNATKMDEIILSGASTLSPETAPTTETTLPVVEEQKAEPKALVMASLTLPEGTKETAQYLITPVFGAKERWFEKKRMTTVEKVGDLFHVTLPLRDVKGRKLEAYVTSTTSTETEAPQE